MSNTPYDPNTTYEDDTEYRIDGATVNSISKQLLDLKKEVNRLKDKEVHDELKALRIRDRNPAVKDAWDKYQTVLKLASGND